MIKTERTTIDGREVIVVQLTARRSLALKTKLIKLLGPAITKLLAGSKGAPKLEKEIDLNQLSPAIETLVSQLDPTVFFNLVVECLSNTRVSVNTPDQPLTMLDVTEQTFDTIFSGELVTMYKVLWFALRVNYADFFGMKGIGDIISQYPMTQKLEKEQSQK